MRTTPGHRDEVIALLVEAAENLRDAGCHLYLVARSATDQDTVWVTEVWESREHHAASLQLPGTRAAIERAMPLLTGEFTAQELDVAGGLGP
ncbi:MAG TPA: putative quinol monooxygenase [Pseudonocardiaceae bacterium]